MHRSTDETIYTTSPQHESGTSPTMTTLPEEGSTSESVIAPCSPPSSSQPSCVDRDKPEETHSTSFIQRDEMMTVSASATTSHILGKEDRVECLAMQTVSSNGKGSTSKDPPAVSTPPTLMNAEPSTGVIESSDSNISRCASIVPITTISQKTITGVVVAEPVQFEKAHNGSILALKVNMSLVINKCLIQAI